VRQEHLALCNSGQAVSRLERDGSLGRVIGQRRVFIAVHLRSSWGRKRNNAIYFEPLSRCAPFMAAATRRADAATGAANERPGRAEVALPSRAITQPFTMVAT